MAEEKTPVTWDKISGTTEFNELPIEQKASVRNRFFEREIAPQAPPDRLDEIRSAFLKRTDDSLRRTEMIGGFPSRPEKIQDDSGFWIDQAAQGAAMVPEAAATVYDVIANSPIGRTLDAIRMAVTKKPTEKSTVAPDFRKALRTGDIVKDIPETTGWQKVGGRPLQWLVGNLPFAAANVATAARPGVAAATEFLSTLGGAEGSKVGEMVGKSLGGDVGGVVGNVAGGLGGGGATAMLLPQAGARGIDASKKGLSRLFQMGTGGRKLTEDQLNEILGPKLAEVFKSDPAAVAKLVEAAAVSGKIPGFKPDLAAATGSTVFSAMKERIAKEGESVQARFESLAERNRKAIDDFERASFPKGGDKPQPIAESKVAESAKMLEDSLRRHETTLQKQIEETDSAIKMLSETHVPSESNLEIGQRLDALQKQARTLRFKQAEAQYLPVYQLADQMGFREDIAPLVEYVQKTMRDSGQTFQRKDMPSVFQEILNFADKKKLGLQKQAVNVAYKGKMPESISQFVARNGGINKLSVGSELKDMENLPKGLFKVGMSGLVRKKPGDGKTVDEMVEKLREAGYLSKDESHNELFKKLEDEFSANEPTHFSARDSDAANRVLFERKDELAQEIFELQKQASKPEVPVTFREFHSLMKRVNEDISQAAQRGWKGQWLNDLKTQIKNKLENVSGEGDIGSGLKKADEFWLQQWKRPFVKGAGGLMQRERVPEENIVERAFMGRKERGAEDWKRIYGDNPEAAGLLYQGAADAFTKASVNPSTGLLDLKKAQTWLSKNDRFLSAFPELRSEFDIVTKSLGESLAEGAAKRSVIEEKLASIEIARKELGKSELAKIAGTEDTAKLIDSAMNSTAEMDQLVRLTRGNTGAKQGLATGMAERILDKSNPEAFLLSHQESLKRAFDSLGPGHWENLMAIIKGNQILERGGTTKRLSTIELESDPMQALLGTSSSSLFSLGKGLGSWVSPQYAVFHVGGRYLFKVRRDQQREFLVNMMTNPEVAQKLADTYKNVTPETADQIARGLYTQGTREAGAELRRLKEELAPLLRLHAIRVSINAIAQPGREEFDQERMRKEEGMTQQGIKEGAARRLRELQGGFPSVPR